MRGLLSFQILWELSKKPMNGQELAKKIAVRRGSKPTPGTIYPALKDLFSRNLIEKTPEGRQVNYKLTIIGREGLLEACRYFYRAFGDIFEDCKCVGITGR
jgi:DNA-binding PadR family transcriptional regulator